MDAIKNLWKKIAPHQFWILSGLVFVASVAIFFLTSSSLSALIKARTTKVDSAFSKLSTVKSTLDTHPNSFTHTKLDEMANALELEVQEAWKLQYLRQEPLLVWPPKAFSAKTETLEIMKNLRPIEQFVDFPVDPTVSPINKITVNDREVYKRYIAPEFAEVSKIIGTEWKPGSDSESSSSMGSGGMGMGSGGMGMGSGGMGMGSGGMGMGSGGMGMGGQSGADGSQGKDLVRWSQSSQQELMSQILPWYGMSTPPSVLDIYYTQEDMWLLTGVMEIIKATNGSAIENFQTKVREIEWIRMGRYANRDAGALSGGAGGGGGMMMGGSGGMMGGSGGMMGGSGGMMGGSGGSMGSSGGMAGGGDEGGGSGGSSGTAPSGGGEAVDPADSRYISFAEGKEFEALKGAELRDAMKNISAQNAVDAVAKRVPIRMRLKIDPNHLNTLITECGNANMMLEVYQVRFNVTASAGGGAGGMMGAASGGGRPGLGRTGGSPSSGGGGAAGGSSGDEEPGAGSASGFGSSGFGDEAGLSEGSEVSIEIFGLVYLYNPVNIGNLGTDKIGETPAENAVPGAAAAVPSDSPPPSTEKEGASVTADPIVNPEGEAGIEAAAPPDPAADPAPDPAPDPGAAEPAPEGEQPPPADGATAPENP